MASPPTVLVLISEPFFQERVVDTLKVVGRGPLVVDASREDLLEFLLAQETQGIVMDLEDQACEAPKILEGLRNAEQCRDWHFVVYSAYEDDDLIARGLATGVDVVPRSTFAASLVRLMQGFGEPPAA